jgi:hypothetical protein
MYGFVAPPGEFSLTGMDASLVRTGQIDAGTGAFVLNQAVTGSVLPQSRGTRLLVRDSATGPYLVVSGSHVVQVTLDTLEGASGSHHLREGWSLHRTAVVTGCNAGSNEDTALLYQEALGAVIALVGDRGSQCPNIAVPTYLDEFVPELLSHEIVRVGIVYRGYPLPTIELDTCQSQIQSNLNASGRPFGTSYTYPNDYTLAAGLAGTTQKQGGRLNKPVQEPSFTVNFLIIGNIGAVTVWAEYDGKLNDDDFTIGTFTGKRHQWKVTRFRATSRDGGNSFDASFTVQGRGINGPLGLRGVPLTWDETATFIDPQTGLPPQDVADQPDAYKVVQMAPECSFPDLLYYLSLSGN